MSVVDTKQATLWWKQNPTNSLRALFISFQDFEVKILINKYKMQAFLKTGKISAADKPSTSGTKTTTTKKKPPAPWVEK